MSYLWVMRYVGKSVEQPGLIPQRHFRECLQSKVPSPSPKLCRS